MLKTEVTGFALVTIYGYLGCKGHCVGIIDLMNKGLVKQKIRS